jgi:hypothetical protein
LSPDGSRIVTERPDVRTGANDIFVVELQRGGVMTRLTAYAGSDSTPIWLADGRIVWRRIETDYTTCTRECPEAQSTPSRC